MKISLIADKAYESAYRELLEPKGYEIEANAATLLDLRFLDSGPIDAKASLVIANTLTQTATSYAKRYGGKAKVAGIALLPLKSEGNLEISFPFGSDHTLEVTEALSPFGTLEFIRDTVAGVFPRTLSMIINEAAFAVQESVATAPDIDSAMRLGTNYPKGPLAWCDAIGAEVIVAVLEALGREYGAERYRAASLLRLHAESGLPFHSEAH